MLLFSATLHSPEIRRLSDEIQKFPTWVDLKGKEAIPDVRSLFFLRSWSPIYVCFFCLLQTVHHGIVYVDPTQAAQYQADAAALVGKARPVTDGVHARETGAAASADSPEQLSETVKRIKPYVLLRVIAAHKMDQALIFVRTKLDADNLEKFLVDVEGGRKCTCSHVCTFPILLISTV